ncbi:hypothetical protein BDV11DRAFT_206119 [Aspergillus similis]
MSSILGWPIQSLPMLISQTTPLNKLGKAPAVTVEPIIEDKSGIQETLPRTINPPFVLEEHPVDKRLPIRAIVVGAGITGVTAGVLLPAKVPELSLVIYERHSDIGGVWHSNTYPGVRCDVLSHVYQSIFSPNRAWTENYSRGAEIKSYWKGIATKYDVWNYVSLNGTGPATGKKSDKTDEADSPRLPDIRGLEKFRGKVIHTGAWVSTFDPVGKRLALIGNGVSGLQILPELQKVAAHADHYTHNPTWVAGTLGGETLSREVPISEELKRAWAKDSVEYLKYRREFESQARTRFAIVQKGGETNAAAREEFTKIMKTRLREKKDSLLALVLPDFAPNSLTKETAEYIRTPIVSTTEFGLNTADGKHRPVDAVIFPGFPDTYLGMAAPFFPNLLFIGGPNPASGFAGTVPHTIETHVTYIAKSFFPTTVLSDGCSSWYNNQVKNGRIVAVWPGSGKHDWEYTYHNKQGNRFGYFGNGWARKVILARDGGEKAGEEDYTPYLKLEAVNGQGPDLRAYHEGWWEVSI